MELVIARSLKVEELRLTTCTYLDSSPPIGTIIIVSPGGLEHGGGIGRQMGYFLSALEKRETSVTYSIVDSRGPWFLGSSPFKIALSIVYIMSAIAKLVMARFSASKHLLHINITGRGSTSRKIIITTIAHILKLRYIMHVHDYDYAREYCRHGTIVRRIIENMFKRAERVLVLGSEAQENLSNLLTLPRERIAVLHNAVPDPITDDRIQAHRSGEVPCQILFLGHLSVRKGVPELLRALASLEVARQQWHATLAGDGPVEEYRSLADDLGIADRIDFPGWLDAAGVRSLCAAADILVLPSHAEGLAMAVLEGLSYGLAVITTPVGAHPEVIDVETSSGILVPPGDVAALADALARVISDSDLRERLYVGSRQRFLEKFEVRSYARWLNQLHCSLLLSEEDPGTGS
jgi:glycosyltransferase involved in cell wall biosynthesis